MPVALYSTATRLAVIIFVLLYPSLYFLEVLLLIFLQPTGVMPERFIRRPFRWLIDRPTRTLTERLVEDKVKQLVFLFSFHFKPVRVNNSTLSINLKADHLNTIFVRLLRKVGEWCVSRYVIFP